MTPIISAKIVQDSINPNGVRITTFELEYPRFIHSELMTHRVFSRNAASSRAIPIEKMQEHILKQPACPIEWGKNQAGMQAKELLDPAATILAKTAWSSAVELAVLASKHLAALGVHKQIANRVTEPFQTMKTIVTSTEWDNWYNLRDHTDAQPEIHELAHLMRLEHMYSKPMEIFAGDWHVPYVTRDLDLVTGDLVYFDGVGTELTIEDARIISASCCAQVSYRKSDDTLEKAYKVFERLIGSQPIHASPIEHQAMCPEMFWADGGPSTWQEGFTHATRDCQLWSNNFRGWIQYRALL